MSSRRTTPHDRADLPAIGVDLGGTKIEAVVLDDRGASLWRERVATPAGDYRAILSAVAALVTRAEDELGLIGCSVGVGTPGSLTRTGHIKNANSTCLNGEPLESDLTTALGRPVRVANDADCLALPKRPTARPPTPHLCSPSFSVRASAGASSHTVIF